MPTVASLVLLVDWNTLKKRWRHLPDLPVESNGGRVDILLGIDQPHLTTAIESRIGRENEPTEILTRLGWIVRGVIGTTIRNLMGRTHAVFANIEEEGGALEKQMRRFCDSEDFGMEYKIDCVTEADNRSFNILESGTRRLASVMRHPSLGRLRSQIYQITAIWLKEYWQLCCTVYKV